MLNSSKKITKNKNSRRRRSCKERLGALEAYITKRMGERTCPVTLEEYDFTNPPFLIDTCHHSISLTALKNFKIYTKVRVNNQELKVMQCPLCRRYFHFAVLNMSYFELGHISELLQEKDSNSEEEDFTQRLKRMTRYFAPKGGCLAF